MGSRHEDCASRIHLLSDTSEVFALADWDDERERERNRALHAENPSSGATRTAWHEYFNTWRRPNMQIACRSELNDLVERALQREVAARRELRPYAQLAIAPNAPPPTVEEAYRRLRARYEPDSFADYGPVAVAAAQTISDLLGAAYETMRQRDREARGELRAEVRPPRPPSRFSRLLMRALARSR